MKVILTMNEVVTLIRKELQLSDGVQVEIEGFGEVDAVSTDPDGWISVPPDWSEPMAPPEAIGCSKIEVMLRDGSIDEGPPREWCFSWIQENLYRDIVKFRKIA